MCPQRRSLTELFDERLEDADHRVGQNQVMERHAWFLQRDQWKVVACLGQGSQ